MKFIVKIISFFSIIGIMFFSLNTNKVFAVVEETDVVKIGDEGYETLKEAIDVANSNDSQTTITLLTNIQLSEALTINKDIIIEGNYTIGRCRDDETTTDIDETYLGTLFVVSEGATLTIDGNITLDGGANWVLKIDEFKAAYENYKLTVPTNVTNYEYITYEKVTSNAPMILVNGTLNVNKAKLTNSFGTRGIDHAVIKTNATGVCNLNDGALITHNVCVPSYGGTAVSMVKGSILNIYDGAEISQNYATSNAGTIYNNGGTITMYGGKINNNYAVNNNGVALMLYQNDAKFIMYGGEICENMGLSHSAHCGAIYLHSTSTMEMYGGTISNNYGVSVGGIQFQGAKSLIIKGGTVANNINLLSYHDKYVERFGGKHDIQDNSVSTITGGTFSQDVTKYCEDEYYYVTKDDSSIGIVKKCEGHEFVNSVCEICKYKCPHSTTSELDREATCTTKAYCSVCDNEYGDVLPHDYITESDDVNKTISLTCTKGCGLDETIQLATPVSLSYDETIKEARVLGNPEEGLVVTYNTGDGNAPVVAGTYIATMTFGLSSVSIEYTIEPATPVITITAPTKAIIPGTSILLDVDILNPENNQATDLPENFIIKYTVGSEVTEYSISGLKLSLPLDVLLGETIEVYVENEEVSGKYNVGKSSVLSLYVGQIDYSGEIEELRKALEKATTDLNIALSMHYTNLSDRITALQDELLNVYNLLDTISNDFATKEELQDAKTTLEQKIEEVNNLITDLEIRVEANEKAIEDILKAIEELKKVNANNSFEISNSIIELQETIKNVEAGNIEKNEQLEATIKEANDLINLNITKIEENLNTAQLELQKAIKDGDSNLETMINEFNEILSATIKAAQTQNENDIQKLMEKVNEGNQTLQEAINELTNRLEQLENELSNIEKDVNDMENNIPEEVNMTTIWIIICVLGCMNVAMIVWYIIDRKKAK